MAQRVVAWRRGIGGGGGGVVDVVVEEMDPQTLGGGGIGREERKRGEVSALQLMQRIRQKLNRRRVS